MNEKKAEAGKQGEKVSTPTDGKREGRGKVKQRLNREVLITKEYKTMGGFIRGCKAVLKKVFDDPYGGNLTMADSSDGPTVEERIRAGSLLNTITALGLSTRRGLSLSFPIGFMRSFRTEG